MLKLRFSTVLFICILTISVSAEQFGYAFSDKDTLSYTLSADSRVDLTKLGVIATILQITNLSQNTYIAADITRESVSKSGVNSIKALFRQVSLVMIKNDSISTSDGSNWGEIKPGAIHRFSITADGDIQKAPSDGGQLNSSMIAFWQFLFPKFAGASIEKGSIWVDTIKFPLQMAGVAPTEVLCRLIFTSAGKDTKAAGSVAKIDYTLEGSSAQNKNLYISGVGYIRFDRKKGRLLENSCDFEMRGMIDLTTMGLPAELNSSLPLLIKSKATAKLQNAN
jgi:hypothetical protein